MLELNLSPGRSSTLKLLCVGAHSDDIEIGCGGTVLTLLSRYKFADVHWHVFSGQGNRAEEARASAEQFLATADRKHIVIHGFRDGYFPFLGADIKNTFESIKREFQPDIVLSHYRDDRHQDHRAISDLTWNTFRDHLVLEYEIPKYDGDLGQPNLFVPLDEAACQKKVEILMSCFATQRGKHWFDEETFRALLRLRGMECNSPTRYAESFFARKLQLV